MRPAQFYEASDGTRLAYLDEGSGPAVVMLHALMANGQTNWVDTGLAEALVGAGYRVIVPDARGHGASAAPDADAAYHPDVLVSDVAALIAMLAVEPVSLVGYSYGARTAAHLAAAGAVKLTSVVLAGAAMSSLLPFTPGAEVDAFVGAMYADDATVAANEPLAQARAQMAAWNARPRAVAAVYSGLCDAQPIDLTAISVPVLLLHSPVEPDDIVGHIPGARSIIVGGDHVTAPLDPRFPEAVLTFLLETAPLEPAAPGR